MKNTVFEWNKLAIEAIRRTKPGPPMAARSLGIIFTCIYDAWAAFDERANPVHSKVERRPTNEQNGNNKIKAINIAAYKALKNQFGDLTNSDGIKIFDQKLISLGHKIPTDSDNDNSPEGIGSKAANDVLKFRIDDRANQLNLYEDISDPAYKALNTPISALFPSTVEEITRPDRWQPLTYLNADKEAATPNFIAPHWGFVKPFAIPSYPRNREQEDDLNFPKGYKDFLPREPQHYTSQGFLDQAKHVIDIQANLTPKQKVIAEYWADGPNSELPPGHWMVFTSYVAERDHSNLDQTVKLFFAVSNAIFDASIATWYAKRKWDYPRPITTIRHLFRDKVIKAWGGPGKGTKEINGETWLPFQVPTFPTPPFAEYTSGHSGFSMAAAEVLKLFTGSDRFNYWYTQEKPINADPEEDVIGITLRWSSFSQAAYEAGESRLYGGIHFMKETLEA